MLSVSISGTPIDPAGELKHFQQKATGAGGIVSFTGLVRPTAGAHQVLRLELDHYAELTQREIEKTCRSAQEKWALLGAHVVHRIGVIEQGEVIVFVATAAPGRRSAFEAADFLMDYLKTDAPFWKKEVTSGGKNWIEPRQQDYADRRRWRSLNEK